MKKRLLTTLLSTCMIIMLCSCSKEEESNQVIQEQKKEQSEQVTQDEKKEEIPEDITEDIIKDKEDPEKSTETEWAIYWYLCGSDLESQSGMASCDLQEMLQVDLPENIKVVIETGGANEWWNGTIDASKLQRYVFDSEGFRLVDELESQSMGDWETLYDFLDFASTNYPAKKTAVIFWNHGAGSVGGVAFDECYDYDSLTIGEMEVAFYDAFEASEEDPPVDLIGFDTCLMATIDVAASFTDYGKYLVASQEVEPGNGWSYSDWLSELVENPDMEGDTLGRIICDTFYKGCEEVGTEQNATLSLTDLTKVENLLDAYESFGGEALQMVCEDTGFFTHFARIAMKTENYGGNTKDQGYSNMVDLGHLARQSKDLLPRTSEDILDALDECVLYKVQGDYRKESTGLSCYYTYDRSFSDFMDYYDQGIGKAFKYFYEYELVGSLSEEGMDYMELYDLNSLPEIPSILTLGWDYISPDIDENGYAVLNLGPEAYDYLSFIGFELRYSDPESDTVYMLGTDNDLWADWDQGIFKDNFRHKWGAIDGNLVYMELYYEGDDYNLYSVPILLNGEKYNLMVCYDFTQDAWSIQEARKAIEELGMADKDCRILEEGDVITTIHYVAPRSNVFADFEPTEVAEFTVTKDTAFDEITLGDGIFTMMFKMEDIQGNVVYSDMVDFECKGDNIITKVYE